MLLQQAESNFSIAIIISITLSSIVSMFCIYIALRGPQEIKYDAPQRPILPSRFSVPSTYFTPPKRADSSDLTWAYAITDLIEAEYRNQGFSNNSLNETEYVRFNPHAIYQYMEVVCQQYPSSAGCKHYSLKNQVSASAAYSFINSFQGTTHTFLPESIQYSTVEEFQKSIEDNPIVFETRKPGFASSVYAIKELLYQKNRPLLFSMPHIYSDYYFSCEPDCPSDAFKCPVSDMLCSYLRTDTLLPNGNFFVPVSPAYPSIDSMLSLVIYGYSDNFVPPGYQRRYLSQRLPRGGFIVKGQLSNLVGHSMSYYQGTHDSFTESYICPNFLNPSSWKTCRMDNCTSSHFLKCIDNEVCQNNDLDPNYFYALLENSDHTHEIMANEDVNGLTSVYLQKIDSLGNYIERIEFSSLQFWELGNVLRPIQTSSNHENCGFWFIPYELVEKGIAYGSAVALDLPVKFSSTSYAKHAPSEEVQKYSGIKNSTKNLSL